MKRTQRKTQKPKRKQIDFLPYITFGLLAFLVLGLLYEFIMSAG